jgi:hypothetical protein
VTAVLCGIGLAALAACCYALAAVLQHDGVHLELDQTGGRLRLLRLLRRPRWLGGLAAAAAGGAIHVVALSLAPLVVIQPVGVLAIGLTVLGTAATGRVPLTRRALLAVLASTVGVGAFVAFAATGSDGAGVPPGAVGTVCAVTGGTVAALVLLGSRCRGALRCPVFAAAAGIAYGSVSVLARALAAGVRADGPVALANPAALAGIVLGVLAGVWTAQRAYASGRPDTVIACQTVLDPLVGVLLGGWLYGEAAGWSLPVLLGELGCAAVATTGVLLLARQQAAPEDTTGDQPTQQGAHHRERQLSRT